MPHSSSTPWRLLPRSLRLLACRSACHVPPPAAAGHARLGEASCSGRCWAAGPSSMPPSWTVPTTVGRGLPGRRVWSRRPGLVGRIIDSFSLRSKRIGSLSPSLLHRRIIPGLRQSQESPRCQGTWITSPRWRGAHHEGGVFLDGIGPAAGTDHLVVCSRAEHVPCITLTYRRPYACQDDAPVGRLAQSLWL